MPVLLIGAAALLAAAGTKFAAAVLVMAAVSAASIDGPVAAVAVWTAALGAGLIGLGTPPRRVALPLVGAAAAVAAGSASNAALVLPVWLLATAAGGVAAGSSDAARAWSVRLALADVPVVVAVGWTVLREGFVTWPGSGDEVTGGLLVAAAFVRALLAAGPSDRVPEAGLLIARTQALVAAVLAAGVTGGDGLARGIVITAAVAFAFAGSAPRTSVRDGVHEVSLAVLALGASALGWASDGWFWGAMAAGVLVHLIGAASPGRTTALGASAAIARAGAFGAPILPVAAAVSVGAADGGLAGAIVAVGLVVGLGSRSVPAATPGRSRTAPVVAGIVVVAVAAGVWAPLIPRPGSVFGAGVWPSWWALPLLGVGAAAGLAFAPALAPARTRRIRRQPTTAFMSWVVRPRLRAVRPRWVGGVLGAWTLVAAAIWVLGFGRGFL